jgi:ComF family protein
MTRYEIDGVFASVGYKGVVKRLIYQFKYNPYISDLCVLLDELFYEGVIQKEIVFNLLKSEIVFAPIPLHKRRLRLRGYNQAYILAKGLAGRMMKDKIIGSYNNSAELILDCLERTKATRPQYGLSQKERGENIRGAFEVKEIFLERLRKAGGVFLVDDIVTTGATLREAGKLLKRAGVKRVYGLVLAHG